MLARDLPTREVCDNEVSLSEGMWALISSSAGDNHNMSLCGTVVLRDGRLLGSCDHRAYAGTYEISDHIMTAHFESWTWHPLSRTSGIFDLEAEKVDDICLSVEIHPTFMRGEITSKFLPETHLTACLMKICDADGTY